MFRIFKDQVKQVSFETDGYTTIPGLLNAEEITALKNLYLQYTEGKVTNSRYGMYVSIDEADQEKKVSLMQEIKNYLTPKLANYFQDYKCHLGAFLVKVPHPHSFTFPHQDWLFVDNTQPEMFSATIWISLEDINVNTGSLGFIKGSHMFCNNIVGSPSPEIKTATMGHEALFLTHLSFPEVKAGDGLIFNNKTIHAAFPNTENKQRIAVGIGITPAPAKLYHYFLNPLNNQKIYKLQVEEAFFNHYGNDTLRKVYQEKQVPKYATVEAELDYTPRFFNSEEMKKMVVSYGNINNNIPIAELFAQYQQGGILSKIKGAIKYFLNK